MTGDRAERLRRDAADEVGSAALLPELAVAAAVTFGLGRRVGIEIARADP